MKFEILRPRKETVNLKGKLSYNEGIHSWSIIRFKKELTNEFTQLKEKRSKFTYNLIFYQDYDELETAIKKLKRNKEAIPMLLWFMKEKN